MDVSYVPQEIAAQFLEKSKETARIIAECVTKIQDRVKTFHGPGGERRDSVLLPEYPEDSDEYYVPRGKTIRITEEGYSYIFTGLVDNQVILNNRSSHILIRKSMGTTYTFKKDSISGIDILYVSEVKIKVPCLNYTNLEFVNKINLNGAVDSITKIYVTGSIDIKINDMEINPGFFGRRLFTTGGVTEIEECFPTLTIIG